MRVKHGFHIGIIGDLFCRSPFGYMIAHSKKVHECLLMIKPLTEAFIAENDIWLHELQDDTSKLEYQADKIKHEIRAHLANRYFLPADRSDLEGFVKCQERMADAVKDFAVLLVIRKTRLHSDLIPGFTALVDQVLLVAERLLSAAVRIQRLADVFFMGSESQQVLKSLEGLSEEEWKSDRIARGLGRDIFALERELDPITIGFYERLLLKLSAIANEAENASDLLKVILHRN